MVRFPCFLCFLDFLHTVASYSEYRKTAELRLLETCSRGPSKIPIFLRICTHLCDPVLAERTETNEQNIKIIIKMIIIIPYTLHVIMSSETMHSRLSDLGRIFKRFPIASCSFQQQLMLKPFVSKEFACEQRSGI